MVLTGMHVPIVRSFAMACLFTLAVLAGRRAISLRGPGAGGDGADAARAAGGARRLVPDELFRRAGADLWLRGAAAGAAHTARQRRLARRFASHLAALALTSALAGTASAPFAAYHFGRMQVYFVVANMVAVPLTALWVMPAGLIALLLMPFGLDWLAYVPMGWGAEAIL